jgi:hypothetical protein
VLKRDVKRKDEKEKRTMIAPVTYSILDHSEYKQKFAYRNHSHKKGEKSEVDKWIEEKAKFTRNVFS